MKRKLIQLSPSTAVISLPSKWLKRNGLVKGVEIDIEEVEDKLIVSSEKFSEQKEVLIDISKMPTSLIWGVTDAAYIAGYDSIKLHFQDSKHSEILNKVVRFMPGFMIFDERKNSIVLKDMSVNPDTDIDKVLQRIFHLIKTLIVDSIEAIEQKDYDTLALMKKRDYNINMYMSYCLRQLNKFGYCKYSKTSLVHTYIKTLEMMADKLTTLFVGIGIEKLKITKEELKAISDINLMYSDLKKIHNKFEYDSVIDLDKKRNYLGPKICKFGKNQNHVMIYLTEILESFHDLIELEMQLNV
ncbi:phosphate uptake regulator PhoU [Candidatus Woesearchaeota archaeon]|jgi:phosphate uptake regulator|nr:phosphate uptake regulator PhoU [Candidatus Woesearchaeota archaeon]MBT6518276.1 phosphate uptake regulator PhoU [Candidatus Woesearchaeota archaeon]MBT7367059.1 phosphate uptake regulator PhoU [Candidatus Woesearchaeota archaeon]